jgi:hypothetical protein
VNDILLQLQTNILVWMERLVQSNGRIASDWHLKLWNRPPVKHKLFSFQNSAFHLDRRKAAWETEAKKAGARQDNPPVGENQFCQLILALGKAINEFVDQIGRIKVSPEL